MPAPRRFTDAQWHEALSWGLGNRATARRLGCGECTVFANRKRLGYPARPRQAVKAPGACVVALVRIGWDAPRIAAHFHVDPGRVRRQAMAAGLQPHPSRTRYPSWVEVDRLLHLQISPSAIAASTGRSLQVIVQRRRSLGLRPRTRKAVLHRTIEQRLGGSTIPQGLRPSDYGAGVACADCVLPRASRRSQGAA